MVFEIGAYGVAAKAGDEVRRAENWPADRLVRKGAGVEEIEDEIVRRVLDGADLLQNDALFAFELAFVENAVGQDIREDVERERRVFREHMGVIGGMFRARRGVEVAAGRLDLFRDRARGAAAGALESHMFEQMRQAMLA